MVRCPSTFHTTSSYLPFFLEKYLFSDVFNNFTVDLVSDCLFSKLMNVIRFIVTDEICQMLLSFKNRNEFILSGGFACVNP